MEQFRSEYFLYHFPLFPQSRVCLSNLRNTTQKKKTKKPHFPLLIPHQHKSSLKNFFCQVLFNSNNWLLFELLCNHFQSSLCLILFILNYLLLNYLLVVNELKRNVYVHDKFNSVAMTHLQIKERCNQQMYRLTLHSNQNLFPHKLS